MIGELIVPILLSITAPEAGEIEQANVEQVFSNFCEDDLLTQGEKTQKAAPVEKTTEKPMMDEKEMPMKMDKKPMDGGKMMDEKEMPMKMDKKPMDVEKKADKPAGCTRCRGSRNSQK